MRVHRVQCVAGRVRLCAVALLRINYYLRVRAVSCSVAQLLDSARQALSEPGALAGSSLECRGRRMDGVIETVRPLGPMQ